MKTLKAFAIICFMGILLQVYLHINLLVSYKYEVDLTEANIKTDEKIPTNQKTELVENVKRREHEITHQQFIVKILFGVFLIGLITSIILIKKNETTHTVSPDL